MINAVIVAFVLFSSLVVLLLVHGFIGIRLAMLMMFICDTFIGILAVMNSQIVEVVEYFIFAICWAYGYYKYRHGPWGGGRGKRITKAIGAKARARLEKIKASMPRAHVPKLSPVSV